MPQRAAIYARFSSDNQREESIDAQVRACEEFARRNGYVIVKTYADRARSATTDRRPEFQQMVSDSANGLFDALIIHKMDRFSRDKYDSAMYKRKLKQNNVLLLSVTEKLDGSPESIIMESLLEGLAEYYSANLAREVMKGMKENAYQCRHTGGIPPLGFDVDPVTKKYVINEEEAETVRLIYDLYLKGLGYDRIMTRLNDLGRKTKKGRPFGKNSLRDVITNAKYAGVYVFNLSASKDARGKRNNHAQKSDEDVIRIEGGVPQIVERAVFDAAQQKMAKNRRSPGSYKNKENYLLSGLIYCGECAKEDGSMYAMAGNRHTAGRNKSLYSSYRCSNRDRTKHSCDNTELRREYIEAYVLTELEQRVFNEANIPALTRKLNDHLGKASTAEKRELQRVESDLAKVTKQLDNIVAAVAKGKAFASLLDKMSELEAQQALLQTRAEELRLTTRGGAVVTEEALRGLFLAFRQTVHKGDLLEIKRFVQAYVHSVVVFKGRVEINFRLAMPETRGRDLEMHHGTERKKLAKDSGVSA